MSYSIPTPKFSGSAGELGRQRLTAAILAHTAGCPSAFTSAYEQHYLNQFKRGRLTIDEVVYYLEAAASKRG